jgi:hypothetical protein
MRTLATVLTLAALTGLSTPAMADDKAKATFRYEAGKSALVRGKLDDAIAAFRDAHAVLNTPNTALSLAQALEKKGELAEALSVAKAGKEIPKAPKESFGTVKARTDLEKLSAKLEPKVAETKPKDPEPTPAEPPKPNEPAPGSEAPSDKPAEPPKKAEAADEGGAGGGTVAALVGFTAFAFGTGLGLGAFFVSQSKLDDLEASCPDGTCASFAATEYRGAETTRTIAYVGFAVGGAGLVTGIIGAVLAGTKEGKKEAASGRPQVSVGLGSLEVRGRF